MTEYTVAAQVIKIYYLTIIAESRDEALETVSDMNTLEIAEEGILKDVTSDHIQIISQNNIIET